MDVEPACTGGQWQDQRQETEPVLGGTCFRLLKSETYRGFLELAARSEEFQDAVVPLGDASISVVSLAVTVIGEQETPAYGLTEQAQVAQAAAVAFVGVDGWQALVREPKLTASAFVLMGGEFEDIVTTDDRPCSFATAVDGDLLSLVPETLAVRLTESLYECGRWPIGRLEQYCMERDLLVGKDLNLVEGSLTMFLRESSKENSLGAGAVEQDDYDEVARVDLPPSAGGEDRESAMTNANPIQVLRRKLSRVILQKGACAEAEALFRELHQLEQRSSGALPEHLLPSTMTGVGGPASSSIS